MHKGLIVVLGLLITPGCVVWWDGWPGETNMVNYEASESLEGEESIEAELDLNVGTLQVEAGSPSYAYQLDLEYNDQAFEPYVEYERDGRTGRLRFQLGGEGTSLAGLGDTTLNVRLNPEVALSLEGRTGVGKTEIDLSGMTIASVRLESGVGETTLTMLDANKTDCTKVMIRSGVGAIEVIGLGNFGFGDFQYQGGVGASSLDFSGSWDQIGEIEIEVGVGGVEILLPRDLGAEVRFSKSFLSDLSISGFEQKSQNLYVSDNMDQVTKVLNLRVRSGIGAVEIRWI